MIEYLNKEKIYFEQGNVKADVYKYEVTEKDVIELQSHQDENFNKALMGEIDNPSIRIFLKQKDSNVYELLYDDIDGSRAVIATKKDDKFYILYYIMLQGTAIDILSMR